MLIFSIVKYAYSISNINSSVNVAQTFECYISKSKLAFSLYNKTYSSAFIVFTLHEIKQRKFFFGTPGRTPNFSLDVHIAAHIALHKLPKL